MEARMLYLEEAYTKQQDRLVAYEEIMRKINRKFTTGKVITEIISKISELEDDVSDLQGNEEECEVCGEKATYQCTCGDVAYCCREHQQFHWKSIHKYNHNKKMDLSN
tara:strand:- start:134 stop:457 length:324 start_codon:yes stop_codon:yes gene_type:complete